MRGTVALLALGAAALPARAVSEGPVAAMPFKNLNSDPALEWLRVGMAETLVSDIRRGGKMKVVERDQVDRALAEIALQGAHGTDASTAARVGRMVGARVIVLGAFQKAGKNLRITARSVEVETGLVLEAAKVTGPMESVLSLQDEIAARLLGEPLLKGARKAVRARKKPTPRLL